MEISGFTKMAAVVARPIKHSLSPFIHNAAFSKTHTDGVYLAWDVAKEDLPDMIANIKKLDMYGINLSMPYKQEAMPYMDELTEEARVIGAINTVALIDGKLIGHNTDGIGFFKALDAHHFSMKNQELTILGGGGAAIAIIAQAALLQAKAIHVFARHSQSYEPLKARLELLSALTKVPIDLTALYHPENNQNQQKDVRDQQQTKKEEGLKQLLQDKINASCLLVNATSVGMDGKQLPLSENIKLHPQMLVVDVIYKVLETPFLKWAKNQNVTALNGLGMLLYQAAESFEMWTGKKMPVEEIKNELKMKIEKS